VGPPPSTRPTLYGSVVRLSWSPKSARAFEAPDAPNTLAPKSSSLMKSVSLSLCFSSWPIIVAAPPSFRPNRPARGQIEHGPSTLLSRLCRLPSSTCLDAAVPADLNEHFTGLDGQIQRRRRRYTSPRSSTKTSSSFSLLHGVEVRRAHQKVSRTSSLHESRLTKKPAAPGPQIVVKDDGGAVQSRRPQGKRGRRPRSAFPRDRIAGCSREEGVTRHCRERHRCRTS